MNNQNLKQKPSRDMNSIPQQQFMQQNFIPQQQQANFNPYNSRQNRRDFDHDTPQTGFTDDDEVEKKELVKNEKAKSLNLNELITLTLKLKKKVLRSNSFADQIFPMLATLAAGKADSGQKASVDIVCVIDTSGSMNGEKIELVKRVFDSLVEYLGPNDRLSIVQFSSSARRVTRLMKQTEENKKEILSAVQGLHAGGGTNIDAGIRVALQILKDRKIVNSVSSIFLLSDGLDGGAETRVAQSVIEYGLKDTFTINSFGFGLDHDPKLMTGISDIRDGSFYFIEKLDTVDECFVECLGGLISAIAKDVELTIKAAASQVLPGLQITKAFGDESMWTKKTDGSYITRIPQLMSDKKKNYVLEVKIPKNAKELNDAEKNIKIATFDATYSDFEGNKHSKKVELEIVLLNETEEAKEDEDSDKDVMTNFYRVRGGEVLGEARKLADAGKYDDAQKQLKNFKEELENCSLKTEQFIVNLVKDIEQAIRDTQPQEYQIRGKHNMMGNARAQMKECAYQQSANVYSNSMQYEMVAKTKAKKM